MDDTYTVWRVWHDQSVIELLARTQTEALVTGAELLNKKIVEINAVRICDWQMFALKGVISCVSFIETGVITPFPADFTVCRGTYVLRPLTQLSTNHD